MRIAIGSDHAGYEDPPPHYKPSLAEHLQSRGYEVIDCGTDGPDSVDYP
ncbi:MAG: RpiB/LacA/LacB family sugar-phosphate isomerase, partial [Candidatus Hydrogenedentes bacterium]|nr:RpiB/LacA/LacB family sugar-phosphate isomerase [Candidatus Hydrogenedentota bacterium]